MIYYKKYIVKVLYIIQNVFLQRSSASQESVIWRRWSRTRGHQTAVLMALLRDGWCRPGVPWRVEEFTEANSMLAYWQIGNSSWSQNNSLTHQECDKPGLSEYCSESTLSRLSVKYKKLMGVHGSEWYIIASFIYLAFLIMSLNAFSLSLVVSLSLSLYFSSLSVFLPL